MTPLEGDGNAGGGGNGGGDGGGDVVGERRVAGMGAALDRERRDRNGEGEENGGSRERERERDQDRVDGRMFLLSCPVAARCGGRRQRPGNETKRKCPLAGDRSCHCSVAPSDVSFEPDATRTRPFSVSFFLFRGMAVDEFVSWLRRVGGAALVPLLVLDAAFW